MERLYCKNNEEYEYEDSAAGPNAGVSSPTQCTFFGRPAFGISVEQIQALIRTVETLLRFRVLKPIPDLGALVRMFLTKSSSY